MTSTVIAPSAASPSAGAELLQSIASADPALHSHLTSLISHLIQHKPSNPFHSLEKFSSQLLNPTSHPHPLLSSPPPPALTSYLSSSPYLFNRPPPPKPVDDEEPPAEEEPAPIPAFIPDLASLSGLLREAGVGLSDEEAVLLDRAVVQLGQKDGIEGLRFWGKVLTAGAPYYIFEAKKASYDEDEDRERLHREAAIADTGDDVTAGRELMGSGANEYTYYVTQSLHDVQLAFVQLPSTCPRYVTDARRTWRLLTGDLTAAVGGFPRFAGVERDLLRALIARITHGTTVVPQGSWKEEEGDVLIENEEWTGPTPGLPVQWTHVRGHLRLDGRVEPLPEDDDGEADDANQPPRASATASEPRRPHLAPAGESAFTVRVHSGLDVVGGGGGKDGEDVEVRVSGLVTACWSTLWPGAVSVARGKEYASVYVGWGLRALGGRVDGMPERQDEWRGELVESVEVLASAEEEEKEREEEAERKKEEVAEAEEEELPGDEEEEAKEEED